MTELFTAVSADKTQPYWTMAVEFYGDSDADATRFWSYLESEGLSKLGQWTEGDDYEGVSFWEWLAEVPPMYLLYLTKVEDYLRGQRHLYKPGFSMIVIYGTAEPNELALAAVQKSFERD